MKCDEAKSLFVDHLYDELGGEKEFELQTHLEECKTCASEFSELDSTRTILRAIPDVEPAERLVFTEESGVNTARIQEWFSSFVAKLSFARVSYTLGGALAALLIVGSLVNLEIKYSENDFSVSMGLFKTEKSQSPALTQAMQDSLFAQFRRENQAVLASYLTQERARTQQQMNQILTTYAEQVQMQRATDMQLISRSLDVVRESNTQEMNSRYRELMRNVNARQR